MTLTSDYEDLVELVRQYESFAARFGAKSILKLARNRGTYEHIQALRSPFSRPEGLLATYRRVASAEDRCNPLFHALTSGYPYEHLADSFIAAHSGLGPSDAAALTDLHRLHWDRARETSWRRAVAALIAIAAFAGQFFTPEVFRTMHWSGYGVYRTALAFFAVFGAGYVALWVLAMSSSMRRSAPVKNVELALLLVRAKVDAL